MKVNHSNSNQSPSPNPSPNPSFGIRYINLPDEFTIRAIKSGNADEFKRVISEVRERHPERPELGVVLHSDAVSGKSHRELGRGCADSEPVGTNPMLEYSEFTPQGVGNTIETFIERVKQYDKFREYIESLSRNFGVKINFAGSKDDINLLASQYDKLREFFKNAAIILSSSKSSKNLSLSISPEREGVRLELCDEKIAQESKSIINQMEEAIKRKSRKIQQSVESLCSKTKPVHTQNILFKKMPTQKQVIIWLDKNIQTLEESETYTDKVFSKRLQEELSRLEGKEHAKAAKKERTAGTVKSPFKLIKDAINTKAQAKAQAQAKARAEEASGLQAQARRAFGGFNEDLYERGIAAEERLNEHYLTLEKAGISRDDAGEIIAGTLDQDVAKIAAEIDPKGSLSKEIDGLKGN